MENPSYSENASSAGSEYPSTENQYSAEIRHFATEGTRDRQKKAGPQAFNEYCPTFYDEISPLATLKYSLGKSFRILGKKVNMTLKGEDFKKMSGCQRKAVCAHETIREIAKKYDRLVDNFQMINTEINLLENKCSSFEIEYSQAFDICRIVDLYNRAQWTEHAFSSELQRLPEHIHMPGQDALYLVSNETERFRQMKNGMTVFQETEQYQSYSQDQDSIVSLKNQRNELIEPMKAFAEATRASGLHIKNRWQDRLGFKSLEKEVPDFETSLGCNDIDQQGLTLTCVSIPHFFELSLKESVVFNLSQWKKALTRQIGSIARGEDFHISSAEQREVIARNPQLNVMIKDFDAMVSELGLLESRIQQLKTLTDRFEVAFKDMLNIRDFVEKNNKEYPPKSWLSGVLFRPYGSIQVPWQDQSVTIERGYEACHDNIKNLVDELYISEAWQAYQADKAEIKELMARRKAIVLPLRAFAGATCSTGIHFKM